LGIFSIAVKSPLNKINIIVKNQVRNIACCCVSVNVEIRSPIPSTSVKKIPAIVKSKNGFPRKGRPYSNFDKSNPNPNRKSPIIQNGISFPSIS